MGILDDLKNQYRQGNLVIKLILANILVFVVINLIFLFEYLGSTNLGSGLILKYISVPADLSRLISVPWTLISYNFVHTDFFHILFNLLWFYWFGQLFIQFIGEKKLLGLYLLGGISGGILFITIYNLLPVFSPVVNISTAIGASAAIMAVVIATAFYKPDYQIYLLFFGAVKLKYIAFFTILIDILSIPRGNAGGHIAHLGGAIFGYIFCVYYRKGIDITRWTHHIGNFFKKAFTREPRLKVTHKRPVDDMQWNKNKVEKQKEIDRILDKIAKGGYESLNSAEKDFLFRTSKES